MSFALINLVTTQPQNSYIDSKVLRVNVGFIMAQSSGFSREMEFSVPSRIKVSSDLSLNHLYATLNLSRTGEGVLVQGTVETTVEDICSRCNDDVGLPIEFKIEELFGRNESPEYEYLIDDDGNIDLAPLIREEAVLLTPMVTPYDENNRCLFCQRTWQDVLRENGLVNDDIDPRFAALQELRQQMEESEE